LRRAHARATRDDARTTEAAAFFQRNAAATSGTPVAHRTATIPERLTMIDDRPTARAHFHIAGAVRASMSSDGLVLLDVERGVVLASNAIGARIWQLVESQLDELEIANQLAREYDVSTERAQHDVTTFLASLQAKGLVTEEPAC
jgi:hypothetical protein